MSNKVWDEERIREEFKRLDSMTGLHGADLPITFGKAKHTLGCFYMTLLIRNQRSFISHCFILGILNGQKHLH